MLSTVQGVTRLVVRYHFMGQPSRLIHTAKFGSEDDLNTKPKLKAQWEERVKKFASSQGPDAAGAEMATMYVLTLVCNHCYFFCLSFF